MKRGLAVIETPISAYMLALVCDNDLPIDIIYNFNKDNYNIDDVISVCSDILVDKNNQREIIISDGANWALDNRRKALLFAKDRLHSESINLEEYECIYANPFTNSFGFYISTTRHIEILSHGSIDYLRYKNIFYEKIKLLVRTGKWMKKPLKYFGLVDIKNPKKGYILVSQTERQWDIQISNIDDVEEIQSQSVFCAWTEHFSYQEAYSNRMISLNAQLIKEYCDLNNTQIPHLFIKIHRRSILPSEKQREMIRKAFQDNVEKIIFIDELVEPKYASYLPAELLIHTLNIKNVIGSASALIWNCAAMEDVDCYSFLKLGANDVGLTKLVLNHTNKISKLLKKPPYDFGYTI